MVWGTWVSAKRQGGGLCSLLSSAARLGSFDGGSVGLAFMDLHTWGLPSRRPPLGTRCGAEWAYPTSTGEEGFFSARVALPGAPPPVLCATTSRKNGQNASKRPIATLIQAPANWLSNHRSAEKRQFGPFQGFSWVSWRSACEFTPDGEVSYDFEGWREILTSK